MSAVWPEVPAHQSALHVAQRTGRIHAASRRLETSVFRSVPTMSNVQAAGSLSSPMSDSIRAIEYASSPLEHPALQMRTVRVLPAAALGQERREEVPPKKSKLRRIPEEAGFVDGDEVDQLPEFLVCRFDGSRTLVVVVDLVEPQLLHAERATTLTATSAGSRRRWSPHRSSMRSRKRANCPADSVPAAATPLPRSALVVMTQGTRAIRVKTLQAVERGPPATGRAEPRPDRWPPAACRRRRSSLRSARSSRPPACRMASRPARRRIPCRSAAPRRRAAPYTFASDVNVTSTDGRQPLTGSPSERCTRPPGSTTRCAPSGANSTCRGRSVSPSSATFTGSRHRCCSHVIRPVMKPSAMCWTTTTARA